MQQDPYILLAVPRNADEAAIKQAYRKLAKIHHPDLNPDDEEAGRRFVAVADAYSLLMDPQARAAFDRGTQAQFRRFKSADEIVREFADLFRNDPDATSLGVPAGARTGDDVTVTTVVDFDEALDGKEVTVRFKRQEGCAPCSSSGSASLTPAELCSGCDGLGHVIQRRGETDFRTHCSRCDGQGIKVIDPCTICRGTGRSMVDAAETVLLPAGVANGDLIERLGAASVGERGGDAGALFVRVEVRPHVFFVREGKDLRCKVPLSFAQATLGAELSIPTHWGAVALRVPPTTHSGRALRISGYGVRGGEGAAGGDLVVEVFIHVPSEMGERERALVEGLADCQDASGAANAFLVEHWQAKG